MSQTVTCTSLCVSLCVCVVKRWRMAANTS
jgi:hypothetical protein